MVLSTQTCLKAALLNKSGKINNFGPSKKGNFFSQYQKAVLQITGEKYFGTF